jgi:hypothetical protein
VISQRFPNEAAAVGRLLTSYSDLEIDLFNCVQVATGDFDEALRAMYGSRGESTRITKGAALGGPIYVSLGLGSDFDTAVDAMRHCLRIRNQYAHHTFWDDLTGALAIGDLERIARLPEKQTDLRGVIPNHVTIALLQQQYDFFQYTDGLLGWINFEGRSIRGLLNNNTTRKPSLIPKPALHD